MRPHTSHIVFVLAFALVSLSASAKTTVQHGFGPYLAAGYHAELLPSGSSLKRPHGFEGGFGFDYRLTASPYRKARQSSGAQFLFNTGLGLSVRTFGFTSEPSQIELPNSIDSDGYPFTYIYQLGNRKDQYTRLGVVIPLMVGAQFKRFYFSVGAKVNVAVFSQAKTQLSVSSVGEYPQFLDPFTSMPEHQFFDTKDLQQKQSVSLASDLAAAAEIGFLLTKLPSQRRSVQMLPELRLALFANYGVASFGATNSSSLPPIQTPAAFSDTEDMFAPIRVNHVLSTHLAGEGRITPLTVGARLILSFSVETKPPYPCHCVPDRMRYKTKK